MPSWLKNPFGKKGDAAEAAAAPGAGPSGSAALAPGAPPKAKAKSKEKKKGAARGAAPPPRPPPPRPGQGGASTHDLAMAAATLGVAPPLVPSPGAPPAFHPHAADAQPLTSGGAGPQRADLAQQQMDADLAMAYGMAAAQAAAAQGQATPQWPPQPSQPQVAAAFATPSPFGDAVSLPPPPAGARPDMAMVAALADSQFTARQADELARTTEAVYQAAVSKALEASLHTVSYDALLRDIKLWIIDLAAATDDVLAALGAVVRRREEVAAAAEAALAAGDDRRLRKLSWQAEQLPAAEDRLRRLADGMAPVGVAVLELQDLRDHVGAATPPLEKAERQRDQIIGRMIKALGKAGLTKAGGSGGGSGAAGAPTDLRDLVAALIDDAQRLPKMPRQRRSSRSGGSTATDATEDGPPAVDSSSRRPSLASSAADLASFAVPAVEEEEIVPEIVPSEIVPEIVPVVEQQQREQEPKGAGSGSMPATPPTEPAAPQPGLSPNGSFDEKKAEEGEQPKMKAPPLWRRLGGRGDGAKKAASASPAASAASSGAGAAASPSSTGSSARRAGANVTVPMPFQLSSSRWRAKGPAGAPVAADTLRRVPALISLHYELRKDSGVVAEAVGWAEEPSRATPPAPAVAAPAPAPAVTAAFDSPEAMVSFVREHGGFPAAAPSRFDPGDRWSVMCAAAGAHDALAAEERDLAGWEAAPGATAAAECHRVADSVARVAALLAVCGAAHDPLRVAAAKHKLPWREDLATGVRWAAQTAALAAMTAALDSAEGAHRTKGSWQRQAVLRPLGHGVMAAFAVHQLAGGFSTEAAACCDTLVEQTVHYARLIDPKWFRGHKVVS